MAFSPVLAIATRLAPKWIVAGISNEVFAGVLARHPMILDRLGDYGTKCFGFDPNDLDLAFIICPSQKRIDAVSSLANTQLDAKISGPLHILLSLVEGRYDADSLFFSRDLTVTGDMEAMLALRNALDDSHIDLPTELASVAGPLGPVVRRFAEYTRKMVLSTESAQWS